MLGQIEKLTAALRTWSPVCRERLHMKWAQGCEVKLEIQNMGQEPGKQCCASHVTGVASREMV